MKKIAILLALFTFGFVNAQAPLEEGALQLNAGLGASGWGTPVYVGLDYGIAPNFTLGGELSYQSYNAAGYSYSILGLQANANYHFNEVLDIPSEWDFYAGANLGYFNWDKEYHNGSKPLNIGLQIGGRYFFTDRFGVNLQFGGGNVVSGAKIGITYKL